MTSVDINDDDKTFENEQSTVTIPLKEYDKLREKQKYITDKDMISVIDKIEELVRALRKHIVRTDIQYMGKHIKTKMDYDMINDFAKEIVKLDSIDNPVLAKYLAMQNFEGAELRKKLKQ